MKKTLKWRLTELPTAGEVAELVDSEVITKEEARDILFNEKDNETAQVDELKRQLEFLQSIIENLSKGNRTTITYTPQLPQYNYWKSSPVVWCNTGGTSLGSGTIIPTYSVNTTNLIN